jgi:transcriptional regulator with XRE-family HTH domain
MAANLTPREDDRRRALDTIMRALDVKDAHLAVAVGVSRSAIQSRRSGGVRLREDQCEQMAAALGVPFDLFAMEAPEILRWLADNRREQIYSASGWLRATAGLARAS